MNGRRNHDTREITMWMRDDKNEDYHYEWECWKIDIKSFSHFFFTASTTPIRWVISFRIFPFTYPFPHTQHQRGKEKLLYKSRRKFIYFEWIGVFASTKHANCTQFQLPLLHSVFAFYLFKWFSAVGFFFLSWWLHIFTES